jgi:hypothetical protein
MWLPVQRTIDELEHLVRWSVLIDGCLNEFQVLALVSRPGTIEEINVNVGRSEPLMDQRLEAIERLRVPAGRLPCRSKKPIPDAPAAMLIGVTRFLGSPEGWLSIQEHRQGAGVRTFERVKDRPIFRDAIECSLTGFVRHFDDPFRIVRNPRPRRFG